MEIIKGMYGQPQAGILANQLLKKRLAKYGYYKVPHRLDLWKQHSQPIQFMLVDDDFGIKNVHKKDAQHMQNTLKYHYEVENDWTGRLYCGITFDWKYNNRYVDFSMLGYIKRQLQRYEHIQKGPPQDSLVGNVICRDILKFNNTDNNTNMSRHVHIFISNISKFFMSLYYWC